MGQTTEHEYQEVYFHSYCKNCKHWEKDNELKHPCDHCMDNPINLNSHKPVDFVEAST